MLTTRRYRRHLVGTASMLLAAALVVPTAHAQPGVGGAGADVLGGAQGSQTVVVTGSYTEVPAPSVQGSATTPSNTATGTGTTGGAGNAAPTGPQPTLFPQDDGRVGVSTDAQLTACGQLALDCVQLPDTGIPATPQPIIDIANTVSAAVSALQIEPIDIGITPYPDDTPGGSTGLVGLNSWIWAANPRESTVGPINRTVTTGPVTITMNAINTGLNVNYGDGLPTLPPLCPVPGVPYSDVFLDAPSPTCNHFLQKSSELEPGGVFKVSVTSIWLVNWTAVLPGQVVGGVIPVSPMATTNVRIGEMQVLVHN